MIGKVYTSLFILLLCCGIILTSCDDTGSGSEDTPILSGQEYLLKGAWWTFCTIDFLGSFEYEDGAYFDGMGGGYDMSGTYPDGLYVDCGDPVTYTYNGSDFSKTEENDEFGFYTITGLFTLNEDGSGGTLVFTGGSCDVVKITENSFDDDCIP